MELKLFDNIEPESPDEILARAAREHHQHKQFVLFSGGNDSMVLLHLAMENGWGPDGVVHVNTGTGVPETTEFVRQVCSDWGVNLHELYPPKSYEEVFIDEPIIDGLPGPGMHHIAYSRLKERPLLQFIQTQKRPRPLGWRDRIGLLTGIRHDESRIRMGYTDSIIDRRGAQVWINPIYWMTNTEMKQYRIDHNLPENPVSANLHISGECLCGTFARPDELEEIRFFYPEVAKRIEGWEAAAKAKGLTYCRWGQRRGRDDINGSPMCTQCVGQMELFDV